MSMGIYKFTNLVNNKVYIGQSTNIEKRKKSHINNYINSNIKDYNTYFYRALRKYGIDNFKYSVIEVVNNKEELENREKYWINHYNSYKKGYNSTPGGGVTGVGEEHPNAVLTKEEVLRICDLLKNSSLTQYEIADKFNINQSSVSEINTGDKWSHIYPSQYPLRSGGKMRRGEKNINSILTNEQVLYIRKEYVNRTGRDIYKEFKSEISYVAFERALCGRTYSHLPVYKKKEKKWI